MNGSEEFPRPRMHPVNHRRWRTGSSGRPLTPRRGSALGLLERSVRPEPEPTDGPSTTDELIADSGRRDAQHRVSRAGRRGARSASRADRLASRAARLGWRAAEIRSAVLRGPSGAATTAVSRAARHETLTEIVEERGEARHRRPSRGHRIAARVLPWIDALLFGYFVAGISNADLVQPWSTPIASLVALAFTAFLVLTVAVFTPWLGQALRVHKTPSGQLRFGEIGPVLTGLLSLWGLLALAIGVTMFVRVRTEADYAGADPWAASAVAVLLALASMAMTGYVLGVAIADGSPEADELRAVGRVLARTEARARRHERRAQRCENRRVRVVRAAGRREARALVRAGDGLAAVGGTVQLVRLRSGAPAGRPGPISHTVDDLDHRELAAIRADLATAPFE